MANNDMISGEDIETLKKILNDEVKNSLDNGFEDFSYLIDEQKMRNTFSDKELSEKIINEYLIVIQVSQDRLANSIVNSNKAISKEEDKSKKVKIAERIVNEITTLVKRRNTPPHYTRFEKARIVGARALQISYGAPALIDYPEEIIDPVDVALMEFDRGLVNMTVLKR